MWQCRNFDIASAFFRVISNLRSSMSGTKGVREFGSRNGDLNFPRNCDSLGPRFFLFQDHIRHEGGVQAVRCLEVQIKSWGAKRAYKSKSTE